MPISVTATSVIKFSTCHKELFSVEMLISFPAERYRTIIKLRAQRSTREEESSEVFAAKLSRRIGMVLEVNRPIRLIPKPLD